MIRIRVVAAAVFVVLAAMSVQAQTEFVASSLRAGEGVNGFPNWAERVLHEWINRARVDPQAELAKCGAGCFEASCYGPMPPIGWSEALNHSARYHAAEMTKQRYFAHDSKCTVPTGIDKLYPAGCDGSASCGCVGGTASCAAGGCTPWTARVMLFGAGPAGEIIASPVDPNQTFYLWLYETSLSSSCTYDSTNGHRYQILKQESSIGLGVDGYTVGDFGSGDPPYRIPSGSHYPRQGPSVELWANWYDSKAPKSASAVVDGVCLTMSRKRGSATNGAWMATATNVASGCHRYYFSFTDSTGATVTYPTTGSLGIGTGASCPDWESSRLNSSCSATQPPPPPPPPPPPAVRSHRRAARH